MLLVRFTVLIFATVAAIVGVVAAVILVFFVLVRLILAVPALAVDRLGASAAMRRSWDLVRGAMWRTIGVVVVTSLAVAVLTLVAFPLFGAAYPGIGGGDVGRTVLATVVGGLIQLLAAPLVPAVLALLYLDMRDRAAGR